MDTMVMDKITKGPSAGAAGSVWGGRGESQIRAIRVEVHPTQRQTGHPRSSTLGIGHELFLHGIQVAGIAIGVVNASLLNAALPTSTLSWASVDSPHFWLPIPDSSICRCLYERIRNLA